MCEVAQSALIQDVLGYLQLMSKFMHQWKGTIAKESEWKYLSIEEMVLEFGTPSTAQPLPKQYRKCRIKQCFANAARLVMDHPELTYNEGFACSSDLPIPLHHAWCTDRKNHVVDVTWRENGKSENERAYVGIQFSTDWLCSLLVQNRVFGVFLDCYGDEKFNPLKHGLPVQALAKKIPNVRKTLDK